ncbi:MAG: amidohydrolase [Thermodesulfobacteriota bacterium]|nr:amidohydrolase [Thermodesulfobacteriota bacterium]
MNHFDINTPADLIFHNARVITMDLKYPYAEFVAIKGNKILGNGNESNLKVLKGAHTKLVDCGGKTIIPGFNDAHCHPLSFAATLLYLDCSPAMVRSITDIQNVMRQKAEKIPPGKWLRAAHYDESSLVEKRPPNRWELDKAAPDNPVILIHHSGQHCVLNSMALKHSGITRDTPESPGGIIHKDSKTREPNGLITGRNERVEHTVPPLDEEVMEQGIKLANTQYLSCGITSLQDTTWTNGLNQWHTYQRCIDRGSLSPRLSMLVGIESLEEFQKIGLSTGSGTNRLRVGGVKIALDESTGCIHPPQEDVNTLAHNALQAGFQISLHVSDIHMLQSSLATIEHVRKQIPNSNHRHRLEHCAVCPPGLLPRLKDSQAIVICQPSFLYYMGQRYLDEVPTAQMSWLYPFGSMQRYGIKTVFSSDLPLVPCNPFMGIYAAVTRKVETGKTLSRRESISVLDALRMYTLEGAYASSEEEVKGSISPGKLADLIVISDDPTQIDPEALKDLKVVMTIIDGHIVWEHS